MKYTSFQERQFRRKVDKALEQVKKILDTTRTPTYAEDQDHTYEDKFALAEFLTNTAIAAQMNVLEHMGMDEEKLQKLCDVVHQDKRSVTLRFAAEDTCTFEKQVSVSLPTHEHEHSVETTKQSSSLFSSTRNVKETLKSKVSKKVTEYHWRVAHEYKLDCFAGTNVEKDQVVLQSRTGATVIVTSGDKKSPIPERTVHPTVDVSLTWLLQQISEDKKRSCCFRIDRSKDTCRTPYRNENIAEAIGYFEAFQLWSKTGARHFEHRVEGLILGKHDPADGGDLATSMAVSLSSLDAEEIFCPVLPLMETPRGKDGTAIRQEDSKSTLSVKARVRDQSSSPLLSVGDVDIFLNEQIRSLEAARAAVTRSFPASDRDKLVTVVEGNLYLAWVHASSLGQSYVGAVGYIEEMLRKQLVAAIGKQVQPTDFDQFIQFHINKVFHELFAPKPFCYSIRRLNHYPDGVLTIEKASDDNKPQPVSTLVRTIPADAMTPMYVPISAATVVEFTGPRFLHGWINHRFSASSNCRNATGRAMLTARARQFSCFLLMVGTITGVDRFTPKDAIIVQNKDEIVIPLLLTELPTAKEFKDAIASLSPEQQRFARSFRGMQLESSVFGVYVVQLKPQLEDLLCLPQDALTKEIQLTQDLLCLFMEYQIPSDLLSYDGPDDASLLEKVTTVKGYVKSVQDVIDNAKKAQLEDAKQKADMSVQRYVEHTLEDDGLPTTEYALEMAAPMMRGGNVPDARCLKVGAVRKAPFVSTSNEFTGEIRAAPPSSANASMSMAPPSAIVSAGTPGIETTRVHEIDISQSLGPKNDFTSDISILESKTADGIDFTMIPKELDVLFETHDTGNALRSTIVEASRLWERTRQENLLSKAVKSSMNPDVVKTEKNRAFDLLDALSRSGSLPIACAELHVVVAVTHTFEEDIMGTVIQDNVNPIEKVERTYLMMATKIYGEEASHIVRGVDQTSRLASSFPALFDSPTEDEQVVG